MTTDWRNYGEVRSSLTFNPKNPEHNYEKVFEMPSMTEPDMALTIREIMSKHSSVQQLPLMKEPIYDAGLSELGISNKSLDLVDLAYYREVNQKRINELQAKLEQQQELQDQMELDARVSDEVKRRIQLEREKAEKEKQSTK